MIVFDKVNFAYEHGETVINDLSFRIENGESVGLIGANGAGKSTVMKLLLGLLAPQSGRIMVDELAVGKKDLEAIRKKLGFVLQNSDNQMFMPTVFEDMMFAPLNYMVSREEAEKKGRHGPGKARTAIPEIQIQSQDLRRRKAYGCHSDSTCYGTGSHTYGRADLGARSV
jgi:ABC-type cobalamin/Fe3+-siderophores transport system ATPase subunit